MPSIAAHMVVAKLVGEKLNIYDEDFIKGNLLPDIIDMEDSHKKTKGKYYKISNIDYFVNVLDLTDHLNLGYITHLLLDNYYLEDFIYQITDGKDVFKSKEIYDEYGYITYSLLQRFSVEKDKVIKSLSYYPCPILKQKCENNIKWFNSTLEPKNLKYLSLEQFSDFLEKTSIKIVDYFEGVFAENKDHSINKVYQLKNWKGDI